MVCARPPSCNESGQNVLALIGSTTKHAVDRIKPRIKSSHFALFISVNNHFEVFGKVRRPKLSFFQNLFIFSLARVMCCVVLL